MKRLSRRILIATALTITAALSFARSEPNAFLNKVATTTPELVAQVKKDPEVMSRYMRHFGMTRDEVINYLNGLKVGKLNSDGVYLVYNAQEWEELQAKVVFFKKGTTVWMDDKGAVILKMSCGNPMVRGTDQMDIVTTHEPSLEMVNDTRDLILASELPAEKGIASEIITNHIAAPDPIIESSAQGFAAAVPGTAIGMPSITNLSFIPALALIPLFGFNNGGGDGPPPPPVPEPATMIVLGGMATAALAAKRRKK